MEKPYKRFYIRKSISTVLDQWFLIEYFSLDYIPPVYRWYRTWQQCIDKMDELIKEGKEESQYGS